MPPPRPEARSLTRLAALGALLGLLLLALVRVGPSLPWPDGAASGHAATAGARWLARVGPAGALMTGVRVVAVALTAYLLLVVLVELLGRLTGVRPLRSFGHLVSTRWARRLVGAVAGLGLAATLTAGPIGAARPASADAITMGPPPTAATPTTAGGSAPVMRALAADDDGGGGGNTDAPVMLALDPGSGPHPDVARSDEASAGQWVIQPGDHLWGVARHTLERTRPGPPRDAEVARYLDQLIETNADVLLVPGDADLVLTGQVFALPPVPPA